MSGKMQCSGNPQVRGDRLIKLMDKEGLTSQNVAKLIDEKREGNTDSNTVSRWKTGKYPLSDKNAAILCTEHNLDKNYFDPTDKELLEEFAVLCEKEQRRSAKPNNLANLEKYSINEFLQITKQFESTLKLIPRYAGVESQILLYYLNSHGTNNCYRAISLITSKGMLKIPIPLIIETENTYLNEVIDKKRSELLSESEYMKKVLLGIAHPSEDVPDVDPWTHKFDYLQEQYETKLKPMFDASPNLKLSVFALSPQPLTLKLGYLLSPFKGVDIFQPHIETMDWNWQATGKTINYDVDLPASFEHTPVLNLSLSSNIENTNIENILGKEISIYTISPKKTGPKNGYLKSKKQLNAFKEFFVLFLRNIQKELSQATTLHLFLSVPIAIAFEIGRLLYRIKDVKIKLYGIDGETDTYVLLHTISTRQ